MIAKSINILTCSSRVGHDRYRFLLVANSHQGMTGLPHGDVKHPILGSSGTIAKDGGRGGALGGPTLGLRIVANPS